MSSPIVPIKVPTSAGSFRALAPAFSDPGLFPDESVNFWLQAAAVLLNQGRWGDTYGLAVLLFVEHNLALEGLAMMGAAAGGVPGLNTGVISGTGAKGVSVSYDTGAACDEKASHWNLTTYGTRLIWLARLFGAGPVQVNTGSIGLGPFGYGLWQGAPFGPGWWTH